MSQTNIESLMPELRTHRELELKEEDRELLDGYAEVVAANGLQAVATQRPDGQWQIAAQRPTNPERAGELTINSWQAPFEEARYWPLDAAEGAERYADQITSGLSEDMFARKERIVGDIKVIGEALPDMPLTHAVEHALEAHNNAIARAAQLVAAGEQLEGLTIEEIERAQRDVYFLLQTTAQVLGGRDWQAGIEHGTLVTPTSMKALDKHQTRYEFRYRVSNRTINDEGDFEDIKGEERDWAFGNGLVYQGELVAYIDPAKRITFEYIPEQSSARQHHTAEDVIERPGGKVVHHAYANLRFSIDLDPNSPAGVAVDLGRDPLHTPRFLREGDLVGRVLKAVNREHGSHGYEGFTEDMQTQLRPLAESLIVKLALGYREHQVEYSQ